MPSEVLYYSNFYNNSIFNMVMKIIYISFIVLLCGFLIGCTTKIRDEIVGTTNQELDDTLKEIKEEEYLQDKPKSTDNIKEKQTKNDKEDSWYKPKPGISWQWQLQGKVDTSYDVDLYDLDLVETPQTVIDELHSRNIKVICYISAGSWEEFRDDAKDFPKDVIGKTMDGWPDENWLDVSNYEKFAIIMQNRLDLAVQKKCDGIEPDNIHAYQEDSGFPITYQDQLNYNKWLAKEAHKRNLSIALKYDIDQVSDLIDNFDFVINEQCFYYNECDKLFPFIKQGKAVLGVEYELNPDEFCEESISLDFSWLKMNYDLDGSRISCK